MKMLFVGACCMMTGLVAAWGQATSSAPRPVASLEVAVTYNPLLANVITNNRFSMQGASVQIHGQFWHGLGVVADVAGLHTANMHGTGVRLDLVTATFGPRYTWSLKHCLFAVFGQALAGTAKGMNSVFPGPANASDSADTCGNRSGK